MVSNRSRNCKAMNDTQEAPIQSEIALSLSGVGLQISGKQLLKNITFDLEKNKVIAIFGFSGSGKSTLLKAITGRSYDDKIHNREGSVKLYGEDVWHDSFQSNPLNQSKIVYLDQTPTLFPYGVYDNIALPVRYHMRLRGKILSKMETDEIIEDRLRKAAVWDEVKDILDKGADVLSTGQKQRVCLARALAIEPEIILLDEPAAHLDHFSMEKLEEAILESKYDFNMSMIIVTHNMQQAARVSDNSLFMKEGEIVENAETSKLFTNPDMKLTEDYITGRMG